MPTILYAYVSSIEKSVARQLREAEKAGFKIDEVVTEEGFPGFRTRLIDRPNGKRLVSKLGNCDTLVVRWLDRLGRNYADVSDTIREFMRRGVVVRTIIDGLIFDGTIREPVQLAVQDALISFMSASARAQAETLKEAQRDGIEKAKGIGKRYLGRKPSFDREQLAVVIDMLTLGAENLAISKATGLSRQAVYRIQDDPAAAEVRLRSWGL